MKTIIFGKESNLTHSLKKKIKKNLLIISSREYYKNPDQYHKELNKENFYLIVNGFSPSHSFKHINSYEKFINNSVSSIIILLQKLNKKKVKKIIFSSSVSVNNLVSRKFKSEINTTLQASTKLLIENIILDFCKNNKISYNICRINNIFGGNDKFSIIYYLTKNNNSKINISNNGNPTRDFIHVDEVANIYLKLISTSRYDGTLNIGTGEFIRVREIIDKYQLQNKIKYSNFFTNELILQSNEISAVRNFYKFKKKLSLNQYLNRYFNISVVLDSFNPVKNNKIKLVCYGTGVAAKQIFSFESSKYLIDDVAFFVDDNEKLVGKKFLGKPILSFYQLKDISNVYEISEVIIAITNISEKFKTIIYKKLINISNTITTVPVKSKLFYNNLSFSDLEESDFEYLFNKKTSSISNKFLNIFSQKNILITGGAGSIGSELVNQLIRNRNTNIVVLDNSEYALYLLNKKLELDRYKNCTTILGDVNDYHLLNYLFKKYKFHYVYHSAAYKHVNLLEDNINSAIKNNILSTHLLLKVCENYKKLIKFTFISSDKADNPKSILGYTKRIGELICHSFNRTNNIKVNIVRFGNVFASRGSAIPLFIKQIRNNNPVTITNKKVERYFMSIRQAGILVIKSSLMQSSKNKIFILDMGKPIKILNLIYKLHSIYGKDKHLDIKEIGLNKGEKLKETLSHNNKIYKSRIKDILYINDNSYDLKKIILRINDLRNNINNKEYNHLKVIKTILK